MTGCAAVLMGVFIGSTFAFVWCAVSLMIGIEPFTTDIVVLTDSGRFASVIVMIISAIMATAGLVGMLRCDR